MEQTYGSSHVKQVKSILILEFKFNWVLHSMFNIRLLGVASIRFSDIKHRNEHSLFSCANLKALPIFKNIYIYVVKKSFYSFS